MEEKYLHFQIEGISFAVSIGAIQEIVPMPKLTKIPDNNALLGVANVRGQIVPVIDFKEIFQLCKTEQPQKLLILDSGSVFGIPVDTIVGIVVADQQDIDKPLALSLFFSDEKVAGVLKKNDRLIVVLDVEKINKNINNKTKEETKHANSI